MLHLAERLMNIKTTRPFRKSLYLLTSLVLLLNSCGESIDDFTDVIQDPAFKVYLDRFEEEASMRGFSIDLSQTQAVFQDQVFFNGVEACGVGQSIFEAGINGFIKISRAEGCWSGRNDLEKENLFFHEIGHAILKRPHSERKLPNGLAASAMCGDCNNFNAYNEFNLYRRDYYINELLSVVQDEPEWGQAKNNFETFWEDNTTSTTEWSFSTDTDAISGEIDNSGQITGEFSLSMESNGQGGDDAARWAYPFNSPQIQQGSTLRFEAKIKSDGPISGDGVSLLIRTKKGDQLIDLVGTQFVETITGNIESRIVVLELPDYSAESTIIELRIVWLPGTSGKVFFDDMKLLVAEN